MIQRLSTVELRKLNRTQIFRTVYDYGNPITKQDLAAKAGMSLPTVTQNLKELFAADLLRYDGTEESTGGRKPRLITVNKDARFAVGMELSPKHIRIVAINLKQEVMVSTRVPALFDHTDAYRQLYRRELEKFLDKYKLSREQLLGVGITLPAVINTQASLIETAPVLNLRNFPIHKLIEGIPYDTFVQNDASAGATAEWKKNPRFREAGATAYLFLGKGVGGAFLFGDTPYDGKHNRSGEFGHMCIIPNGDPCACGKRGCLEAYCSTARLTDDLGIDLSEFFSQLEAGNPQYERIWESYLSHLAQGLNLIYTTMDCEIIIGGLLSPYLEPYLPRLWEKVMALHPFAASTNECNIFVSRCGENANCIGVAARFIDQFIRSI